MMDGLQEVAADPEQILDGSVHREKPLRVGRGFEPAHLTLPLPRRLMRDFRPIVRVLVGAVHHRRHHGAAGRWVAAQCVGDQSSRDTALSFQQLPEETEGRQPIAALLDENVDRVAVLVDGPPQILLPPHHRDPFDRGLVSQVILHGMSIVMPDPAITVYPAPTLW
jgi:hypothetical protein